MLCKQRVFLRIQFENHRYNITNSGPVYVDTYLIISLSLKAWPQYIITTKTNLNTPTELKYKTTHNHFDNPTLNVSISNHTHTLDITKRRRKIHIVRKCSTKTLWIYLFDNTTRYTCLTLATFYYIPQRGMRGLGQPWTQTNEMVRENSFWMGIRQPYTQ